jgi:hypothetical protein
MYYAHWLMSGTQSAFSNCGSSWWAQRGGSRHAVVRARSRARAHRCCVGQRCPRSQAAMRAGLSTREHYQRIEQRLRVEKLNAGSI